MNRPGLKHLAVRTTEENLRAISARLTHQVVLRRGRSLGMYVGCGFPKSGTVWLCQLLGTTLGVPYPRNYQSPVMMEAVIHAHWRWSPRLPPTAYIRRDGRDVIVSLYFHFQRAMSLDRNPLRRRRLDDRLAHVWGEGDPADIRSNLPRFIESEMTSPLASPLPWQKHVADWWGRPGVSQVSYEGLLADPETELRRVVHELTGADPGSAVVAAAVRRYAFQHASGRAAGTEDRSSFLRKGVAGDWRNHFTREAGEVFDHYAGEQLVELGYADDHTWFHAL